MTSQLTRTIEWVSPEQSDFYREVERFARTLPRDARDRDPGEAFSRDGWDRCGAFGIQGLPAKPELGGGGADAVTTMLALEALGYGCTDAGLVFSINAHLWTSVIPLTAENGMPAFPRVPSCGSGLHQMVNGGSR